MSAFLLTVCGCVCGCIQAPDWNEEMQTARDLPQTTLEERLQREKALLQVHTFKIPMCTYLHTLYSTCLSNTLTFFPPGQ